MSRIVQSPRQLHRSGARGACPGRGCGSKGSDSDVRRLVGSGDVSRPAPASPTRRSRSALSPISPASFAPLAKPIVQANQLYWKERNAQGRRLQPQGRARSSRTTATTRRRPSCSTASWLEDRRPAAAARLADHRGAAADAQDRLDALAAVGVAVVAAGQRLHHRDRRPLRHRDDQRARLPQGAGQDQVGRQDRAPLLRGRVRRERPEGLQVLRLEERHDGRRAEDPADRRGHVRPGRPPSSGPASTRSRSRRVPRSSPRWRASPRRKASTCRSSATTRRSTRPSWRPRQPRR